MFSDEYAQITAAIEQSNATLVALHAQYRQAIDQLDAQRQRLSDIAQRTTDEVTRLRAVNDRVANLANPQPNP